MEGGKEGGRKEEMKRDTDRERERKGKEDEANEGEQELVTTLIL